MANERTGLPRAVWIGLALAGAVAVGAFLIGPPPEKGASTSQEALAASTGESIEIQDPVHQRPFDALVFRPEADADRNQLVVISHGFSGGRTSHDDLAADLATRGYTVVAPTHPDLAGLESDDKSLDPLALRPRHLSLAIDEIETDRPPFESVTVVGHSLGAYSALRLAGAHPSTSELLSEHCDTTDDQVLCSGRAQSRFAALATDGDLADDRVDNIVLLAPGYGPLFQTEDLDLNAAVLVVQATNDTELPGGQVDALIDRLPSSTQSTSVEGSHYVFLRPCTEDEAASVGDICSDAEGVDRVAIHSALAQQIDDFVAA